MIAHHPTTAQVSEITCLRTEIAQLQQRNEVLENCLLKRDRSIAQLQQHNQILLRDYAEAKAKAEKAYAELSKLEEAISSVQIEVQQMRSMSGRRRQ